MNGMRTERGQGAAGATREEPWYRPGVRTGRRGRGSGGTGPAARRSGSAAGASHAIAAGRRLGNFVRTSGGAGARAAGCPVRARAGSPGATTARTPTGARGAARFSVRFSEPVRKRLISVLRLPQVIRRGAVVNELAHGGDGGVRIDNVLAIEISGLPSRDKLG